MKVLAIETTCDETSAAVLCDKSLLSSYTYTQIPLHKIYHGVVPELASRAHLEKISAVLKAALENAKIAKLKEGSLDAIAFSRGPGLPGSLMVGRVAAEVIAELCSAPLIGVNHLEGHLLACEFEGKKAARPLSFPLLALLVSGGHTELWLAKGYGDYKIIGRTRDDAAGEAFDKVAKLLNLPYPGGPELERLAWKAKPPFALRFPRPYLPGTWDFSFSGIKTAVSYYLKENPACCYNDFALIARAFQDAIIDTLTHKVLLAAKHFGIRRIAIGGGVSANAALRLAFSKLEQLEVRFSQLEYCSDNAAMIALCALRRLEAGAWKQNIKAEPELREASWVIRR